MSRRTGDEEDSDDAPRRSRGDGGGDSVCERWDGSVPGQAVATGLQDNAVQGRNSIVGVALQPVLWRGLSVGRCESQSDWYSGAGACWRGRGFLQERFGATTLCARPRGGPHVEAGRGWGVLCGALRGGRLGFLVSAECAGLDGGYGSAEAGTLRQIVSSGRECLVWESAVRARLRGPQKGRPRTRAR